MSDLLCALLGAGRAGIKGREMPLGAASPLADGIRAGRWQQQQESGGGVSKGRWLSRIGPILGARGASRLPLPPVPLYLLPAFEENLGV